MYHLLLRIPAGSMEPLPFDLLLLDLLLHDQPLFRNTINRPSQFPLRGRPPLAPCLEPPRRRTATIRQSAPIINSISPGTNCAPPKSANRRRRGESICATCVFLLEPTANSIQHSRTPCPAARAHVTGGCAESQKACFVSGDLRWFRVRRKIMSRADAVAAAAPPRPPMRHALGRDGVVPTASLRCWGLASPRVVLYIRFCCRA
ncbi:hypothetical protein IWX90DRAFT_169157 [Phyllosticta citrichinensis]|uniref:Uncharacterized protein n=1 Tax=Phyllosticta citrichinensis TaxID=1130410 RepID=A0ABR1Y128_9PEZI